MHTFFDQCKLNRQKVQKNLAAGPSVVELSLVDCLLLFAQQPATNG